MRYLMVKGEILVGDSTGRIGSSAHHVVIWPKWARSVSLGVFAWTRGNDWSRPDVIVARNENGMP